MSRVSLPLAICLCLLISGLIGVVVERLTVRPALKRGVGSMGWVVSTLGLGILIQGLAAKFFGSQAVAFPEILFSVRDSIRIAGVALSLQYVVVIVITLVIMSALELLLRYTRWGHAVRAVSEDAELARVQGIPVDRIVISSFVDVSLARRARGIVGSSDRRDGRLVLRFDLVLLGFVAAVLGGMGRRRRPRRRDRPRHHYQACWRLRLDGGRTRHRVRTAHAHSCAASERLLWAQRGP